MSSWNLLLGTQSGVIVANSYFKTYFMHKMIFIAPLHYKEMYKFIITSAVSNFLASTANHMLPAQTFSPNVIYVSMRDCSADL